MTPARSDPSHVMQFCHQILVSKELGGGGSIALQLAAALRERMPQTCVWVPGDGPAASRAAELGVACHRYDPAKAFTPSKIQAALCNWKIGRLLRRQGPGLVHVHSPLYYGALSSGLNISRLKRVVHIHLEEEKEGLRWALKNAPDVIITCARFLVEHVRSALPERRQEVQEIVAVPNAVNTEQFYPGDKISAKARLGVPPQTALVLMIANLAPHKGQETALRTAALLREKGVPASFWFAGSERGGGQEYTTRLKALVNDLGIAHRVRFLGQRSDIPELLRAADFSILPSTAEGLPLSILEAQASRIPVLAAPTAGIPEAVIDGKTGFLVAADDAAGYAHRLSCLLGNPTLYERIAGEAYASVVKDYTWNVCFDRIWDVYQRLLRN